MLIEKETTQIENQLAQTIEQELQEFNVIKRNKETVPFNKTNIEVAVSKAFLSIEEHQRDSNKIKELAKNMTQQVIHTISKRYKQVKVLNIEDIQDQVELTLMRNQFYEVAKKYIIYRDEHAKIRLQNQSEVPADTVWVEAQGKKIFLTDEFIFQYISKLTQDLEYININELTKEISKNIYKGISFKEFFLAITISLRSFIEIEPNYSFLAARVLLYKLFNEVTEYFNISISFNDNLKDFYPQLFKAEINRGIEREILSPKLKKLFDLDQLAAALDYNKDNQFTYLGLQTLYDRYFIHDQETRYEMPQNFFMRVAMGLAIEEKEPTKRAIEFYNLLSSFDFMSSTPTLFNSGTNKSQLSSCYLTTVPDDLEGIFNSLKDDAKLSKWSGGLGNDWTRVRALGSRIKGTNGKSQGVVPFLKIANDTAVAVNQGGKRKGAMCAYLETWHYDIEEFLELRKNTGDDRRRTHDMNTANWIPDLFMKRVFEKGEWSLFSPNETLDLHELVGKDFEKRYLEYEQMGKEGKLALYKSVDVNQLWRKMLTMLYETGHPWITFKDPCNLRSPQQHIGVVHSSNLCTEITLNTNDEEIAVCNLGSVNLVNHIKEDGKIDQEKLKNTVRTAIRMLDNVIDINYYSVETSKDSNLKHRPIGMGMMGFQDCLYKNSMSYASNEAVEFADESMEMISYYAIEASCDLAKERGAYRSYQGSLWSQGILPIDSIQILKKSRGEQYIDMNLDTRMDWDSLREKVKSQGMRNSNVLAIAPTATISNIINVTQSIEPTYQNLYVKSNLSGEFILNNVYFVEKCKELGIWDRVMVNDLKFYDGSVAKIERVPENLKKQFVTAFEIEPKWLVEAASRRQKWIDQSQSLNLYISDPNGKKLDITYKMAWYKGLKTTYYLRSLGATSIEKSTVDKLSLNKVTVADVEKIEQLDQLSKIHEIEKPATQVPFCSLDNPDCEACQ